VDELQARESHQLREQKIHIIHAAIEVELNGAEKVTTSKRRQFQVCLNAVRPAATIQSDGDLPQLIEGFEPKIHHVTPAKRNLSINCPHIMSNNYSGSQN
jgi:hypothetical protein